MRSLFFLKPPENRKTQQQRLNKTLQPSVTSKGQGAFHQLTLNQLPQHCNTKKVGSFCLLPHTPVSVTWESAFPDAYIHISAAHTYNPIHGALVIKMQRVDII